MSYADASVRLGLNANAEDGPKAKKRKQQDDAAASQAKGKLYPIVFIASSDPVVLSPGVPQLSPREGAPQRSRAVAPHVADRSRSFDAL